MKTRAPFLNHVLPLTLLMVSASFMVGCGIGFRAIPLDLKSIQNPVLQESENKNVIPAPVSVDDSAAKSGVTAAPAPGQAGKDVKVVAAPAGGAAQPNRPNSAVVKNPAQSVDPKNKTAEQATTPPRAVPEAQGWLAQNAPQNELGAKEVVDTRESGAAGGEATSTGTGSPTMAEIVDSGGVIISKASVVRLMRFNNGFFGYDYLSSFMHTEEGQNSPSVNNNNLASFKLKRIEMGGHGSNVTVRTFTAIAETTSGQKIELSGTYLHPFWELRDSKQQFIAKMNCITKDCVEITGYLYENKSPKSMIGKIIQVMNPDTLTYGFPATAQSDQLDGTEKLKTRMLDEKHELKVSAQVLKLIAEKVQKENSVYSNLLEDQLYSSYQPDLFFMFQGQLNFLRPRLLTVENENRPWTIAGKVPQALQFRETKTRVETVCVTEKCDEVLFFYMQDNVKTEKEILAHTMLAEVCGIEYTANRADVIAEVCRFVKSDLVLSAATDGKVAAKSDVVVENKVPVVAPVTK